MAVKHAPGQVLAAVQGVFQEAGAGGVVATLVQVEEVPQVGGRIEWAHRLVFTEFGRPGYNVVLVRTGNEDQFTGSDQRNETILSKNGPFPLPGTLLQGRNFFDRITRVVLGRLAMPVSWLRHFAGRLPGLDWGGRKHFRRETAQVLLRWNAWKIVPSSASPLP
jgi:hypothetical protein